jgi:hypothetical protein
LECARCALLVLFTKMHSFSTIVKMRGRISHLSTLSKRFAAILRRCDVESFLGIGRVYPEIAPIEKRIDMHIDLLKREEFRELECVSDVSKFGSLLIFNPAARADHGS